MEGEVKDINLLENQLVKDDNHETNDITTKRANLIKDIWKNMHLKDNLIWYKPILTWINEGDLNTRFFHNCLKSRYRKNFISYLETSKGVMEVVSNIRE